MKLKELEYLIKDKDITHLSNFKTPAKSKYYFEIHDRQDIDKLVEIYYFSKQNNLKVLLVWWGTNMLFAFDLFDWIVINNCLEWWSFDYETNMLESYSSEYISDISLNLFNKWIVLWKRFIWLPWSIWWAIFWNAWCFWLETENNFISAEVLDVEIGNITILNKNQMDFEYRSSVIKKTDKYFIISAKFDLSTLIEKYSSDVDNLYFREYKQPKGNTCGSFFKNPSKEQSAWKLIEEVWLKWKNIGWAFFSELHANFLMNDWAANYRDLLELINLAQKEVKNTYNIDLVPEVRIITN